MATQTPLLPQDGTQPPPRSRPRSRNQLSKLGVVLPLIIATGLILGSVITAVSLTARRGHTTTTGTTTTPATLTFPSVTTAPTSQPATTTEPGSCRSQADCAPNQICVAGFCTNITSTSTSTSTVTSTSTRTTTKTTTRTTSTTHPATTTSNAFATCQACSLNAQTGSCASEYAACLSNTYNCPVLCYGTFQLNGNPPATCTNGAIPQWPPLRECLCRTASYPCDGICTGCDYVTGTTVPETTAPAAACESCYDAAVAGPCSAQAALCNANPVGTCALACAPYYRANLLVFPGCNDSIVAPGWPALGACLCPLCGNNYTCTQNQC